MSSPIDVRVPPIFQNHQQLGDFVMPTSSYNSFVSKYEKAKYLFNSEFCKTEYWMIENCWYQFQFVSRRNRLSYALSFAKTL